MEILNANLLINIQMALGEGPVWNKYSGKLNFVDIDNKKIYEYDPTKKELCHIDVDNRVGCLVPTQNGDVLAGITNRLILIDNKTKKQSVIRDFNLQDGLRFNDGKCDKYGRMLIGTMAVDQNSSSAKNCGSLYSYENGKKIKELLSNLSIPNGLAFSNDNEILYHIDTPTQTIMAYPYNLKTGDVSKGVQVFKFPLEEGSPDGMCIDENDNLWVALWGGYKVVCIDTKLKKVITQINVNAKYVSCCTFGGKELNELFITSAKDENGNVGQVFHIKLSVKGTLPYEFRMGR